MKRQALASLSGNMTRAEQFAQWKESRADPKKRPRPEEPSDDQRKKVKSLQKSLQEKDAEIDELQKSLERYGQELHTAKATIGELDAQRFRAETEGEALAARIAELKACVRKGIVVAEADQERIRELEEQCTQILALQSHITELSLLNQCLKSSSSPQKTTIAAAPTIVADFNGIYEAEKMALEAEMKALRAKNDALQARCDELQFNEQFLIQQNAELIENGQKFVASRDAQHRSERCAERDELTAMMNSMESELSGSLDKSLKKIVELQAEIAHLRHQQSLSDK